MEKRVYKLEELLKNRTLYHFYQLSQIPRGSGNEKAVSDFILKWAKGLGLFAVQDHVNNVIIKKPASRGYEDVKPVIMQAHLDMVCDKEPGVMHDFLKDPIPWKIEEDWIYSAAGTTLGADCGIGVALIMSVLEDENAEHPAIEVLFTVREETDFGGAYEVDPSLFEGKRMINLDTAPDDKLLAGSCGGVAFEMELPLTYEEDELENCICVGIEGLKGGHSGSDINKGRGNAIKLLGQLLKKLTEQVDGLKLVSFEGGSSRVAIPREAAMILSIPFEKTAETKQICEGFCKELAEIYADDMENKILRWENVDAADKKAITKDGVWRIIQSVFLLPDGIEDMNGKLSETVESSSNLGVAKMVEGGIRFMEEIRSTYPASRDRIVEKGELLCQLLGGKSERHSAYPEWRYKKYSALREDILNVCKRHADTQMQVIAAHAGNEIGILYSRLQLEDAAAMGPTRYFFHSPKEKLSISSTVKFEGFLKEILAELK